MRKCILILMTYSLIFLCGCLPLTGYGMNRRLAESGGKRIAVKTLDIGRLPPDMEIFAPLDVVSSILTMAGADDKFHYRADFERSIKSVYEQEGIIGSNDLVLLNKDDSNGWVSVIVLKQINGTTSVWFRKPTWFDSEPDLKSAYHKDWRAILKSECMKRNINFKH